MTTNDLIALLQKLDPSGRLEVLSTMCSDYGLMEADEISIVTAVEKPTADYIMRDHYSLTDEDRARAKQYVHFSGN